ncbi:MAG: Omp28-related outer membrane protein [Saprospiraceae bacterium]|nr:Omp28-related outer membrane protein [Saprospiraceae bacterium]
MRFLIIITILSLLAGCSKEQPQFNLLRPEAGDRVVLVEEFSGALCPNCPQGTAELESLKEIYGDRLIILTIHAGDFAFPFSDSKFDFATDDGDVLLDLLGNPIGYPSGVVNRKREGPQDGYQLFSSRWATSIASSLEDSATVQIDQDIAYDPETRELEVTVTILPFQNFQSLPRLTVVLKEDGIIDPQADRADPTGVVTSYEHKNVLRTVLSSPSGDPLASSPKLLEAQQKNYRFTLPEEEGWWIPENCSIVAFLTEEQSGTAIGEVLQATEAPIR